MVDRRVLVVGAGLAGLSAAYQLARRRVPVTIVEARNRIGGRAWTVRGSLAGDTYAELGAEFIDDDHRHIRALAGELGVETVRVLRCGFTQRYRGDDGLFELSRSGAWTELRDALAPLTSDYKKSDGHPDDPRVREMATYSVREWFQRQGVAPHLHSLADALRGFFLADPEELSALPLAAALADTASPAQVPMHRVVGGNDRLIDALVHATTAQLLLQHRVVAIRHAPERVFCSVTDDHGRRQELQCSAVIISVPAAVLSHVDISPSLPERQSHAIRALRYGCATKVVVQTSADVFGTGRARAFATDTHVGAFWDASEGQHGGAHVVSFLAGGSASRLLATRASEDVDGLLSDLCWLRRGPAPRSRGHAVWTWEDDPLARGGYAYLDPGFDPAWLPLLRQRHGRLFFAGEHTSAKFQGYMEGAVESGERVADEVSSSHF